MLVAIDRRRLSETPHKAFERQQRRCRVPQRLSPEMSEDES